MTHHYHITNDEEIRWSILGGALDEIQLMPDEEREAFFAWRMRKHGDTERPVS